MDRDKIKPVDSLEKAKYVALSDRVRKEVPASETKVRAILDKTKEQHPINLVSQLLGEYGWNTDLYPDWLKKVEQDFGKNMKELDIPTTGDTIKLEKQ